MRNLTKCKKGSEPPDSLLRMEYFEKYLDRKPELCKIKKSMLNKNRMECQMKCPIECTFTYYTLDLDVRYENVENDLYTKTIIRLNHNLLPDYIIKHVPEITLITLFCNFAGIISLWLGFSIISVTQDIVRLTIKFIMSKCSFIINIQNITLVRNPTFSFNNKQRGFVKELSSPSYLRPNCSSSIDNIDVISLK